MKYDLGSKGRTKTLPPGITKKQSHYAQELKRMKDEGERRSEADGAPKKVLDDQTLILSDLGGEILKRMKDEGERDKGHYRKKLEFDNQTQVPMLSDLGGEILKRMKDDGERHPGEGDMKKLAKLDDITSLSDLGGEILKRMKDDGERQDQGMIHKKLDDQTSLPPKLLDLGVSRFVAHRWQLMARLPKTEREEYIEPIGFWR